MGYLSSLSGMEWNHFIFYWKFDEYQSYSITVHKKELDIMRFRHNEVNFEASFDDQ